MKKIIIVDDEKTVSKAIGFALKKKGYEVEVIQNPFNILRQLEKNDFDLLILDYNFSFLSGADVIKLLQNKNIQIPTVIISSQDLNAINNLESIFDIQSNFISKDQPIATIINQIESFLLFRNHNHL
jgi:DNA-binding response OmpR family regulator